MSFSIAIHDKQQKISQPLEILEIVKINKTDPKGTIKIVGLNIKEKKINVKNTKVRLYYIVIIDIIFLTPLNKYLVYCKIKIYKDILNVHDLSCNNI